MVRSLRRAALRWMTLLVFGARALSAPLVYAQVAGPPPAAAEAASPDPGADARALELLTQAKQRFEQGDYAGAVPLLEQAHALTQSPRYLLNLGIAHHYMGECALALHYYQSYLQQDPGGEGRADAANAVDHLTPICGLRAVPAPSGPPASSDAASSDAATGRTASSAAPPSSASAAAPAGSSLAGSNVEGEAAREPSRRILGWSLLGAGALAAGVAVVLGVSAVGAKSDRQALQKSVPAGVKWDEFAGKGQDAQLDHDFHRNQVLAWVFSGAAGLLLGAGGAFLLTRDEPSVSLSISRHGQPELQYAARF